MHEDSLWGQFPGKGWEQDRGQVTHSSRAWGSGSIGSRTWLLRSEVRARLYSSHFRSGAVEAH